MPITDFTVKPIKPVGGKGGTQAADVMTMPIDDAGASFQDGDVVIIGADNKGIQISADPAVAGGTIFGVLTHKSSFASAAAVGDGTRDANVTDAAPSVALVYPAWPGRKFAGNGVAAAGTDITGVYLADILAATDIVYADATTDTVAAGEGVAVLEITTPAQNTCYTLEYVTPQFDIVNGDWQFGREAGVGITNPRLVFVFKVDDTVFGT